MLVPTVIKNYVCRETKEKSLSLVRIAVKNSSKKLKLLASYQIAIEN